MCDLLVLIENQATECSISAVKDKAIAVRNVKVTISDASGGR
jgi:hypothetical protein